MKYCAWETPGHSHLCPGTVTGCPEECTWTPWDRIQKFQQGSCLKGHRKISGQTYALFLGPGHVPLYLPPPLSPFFILYTRAHRHTHPHTLTDPMFCSISLVMRQIPMVLREREMVIVPRRILVVMSKGWRRRQPICMKLRDMLREGFYMPCPQRFQRKHETENSSFHFSMTYSVFILQRIWEEKRSKGKLCRFPYFQAPLLKFFIDGR